MFIVYHVITLNKWNEVCVTPPRIIQRCPNRGDVGSRSCAQERCKELNGYVKCPNFPYCMDKWYIDKYCPKDNDWKKIMKMVFTPFKKVSRISREPDFRRHLITVINL